MADDYEVLTHEQEKILRLVKIKKGKYTIPLGSETLPLVWDLGIKGYLNYLETKKNSPEAVFAITPKGKEYLEDLKE